MQKAGDNMADGSIVIETNLDAQKTFDKLTKLESKTEKLKEDIELQKNERMPILDKSNQLEASLDAAKEKLHQLTTEGGEPAAISKAEETVKALQTQWDDVISDVEKYNKKIAKSERELDAMETRAGELARDLSEAGFNAKKMGDNTKKAGKSADAFSKRIKAVVRSALVFTVITQSLSKLRDWIGDIVKASPEASAAIAKLKGALLTMVQPLVSIVIPAFTALVNILTTVVGKIAQFFALLSGNTLDGTKQAAKALNAQTKALDDTGSAAKKAGKSLASFDTINKLSTNQDAGSGGGSSENGIEADFGFNVSEFTGDIEWLLDMILLIGSALGSWKLGKALGLDLKDTIALFLALYYSMQFVKDLLDIWNNGADWDNVIGMISSAAIVAGALGFAFGKVAAGISLIITGTTMIVAAFHDITKNGANLQNTLLLIAGIVATGLGFFLLTGSVIPLVIAGIAAIIVAVLGLTGNLEEFLTNLKENILGGLIDFITGVFTGDWEKAWGGVKKVFYGIFSGLVMIFESVINLIIKGINWVIEKMNGLLENSFIDKGLSLLGINFTGIPPVDEFDLVSKLPGLAKGAVIPPNREFLAVLGDQKSGTNIETPLATMIDAFKTAMRDMGGNQSEAYLVIDEEVLGKIVYKLYNKENKRVGVRMSNA